MFFKQKDLQQYFSNFNMHVVHLEMFLIFCLLGQGFAVLSRLALNCSVIQTDLKLEILLPQLLKY